jgi:carbon-monoxide dehydrogenase small subunit
LIFAVECQEKEIVTIEGLEDPETGELHPIQRAFVKYHGLQCGYCTPGMIISAKALLDKELVPTEEDIKAAINGNICRCTGYISIVNSILAAAEMMREQSHDPRQK